MDFITSPVGFFSKSVFQISNQISLLVSTDSFCCFSLLFHSIFYHVGSGKKKKQKGRNMFYTSVSAGQGIDSLPSFFWNVITAILIPLPLIIIIDAFIDECLVVIVLTLATKKGRI